MESRANQVERVVFCSGKVYYDLVDYRAEHGITNTAIVRIEQIYPFDEKLLKETIGSYSNCKKWVWCQEEPLNMGAWTFIAARLEETLDSRIRYSGRDRASSTAEGSKAMHKAEQQKLLTKAFEV